MLPDVRPSECFERLVFSVDAFRHALQQQPAVVMTQQGIPLGSPKTFDYIPTGTEVVGFKLVDDPVIPANWTVEALKIAVDDEDQIVQMFAGGNGEGSARFGLILFSIAEERPYFSIRRRQDAAIFHVLHKTRLINGVDWTKSHRNGRKLPERRHQPGMRIGREAGFCTKLVTKIKQVLFRKAAFEVCACVDSRR